jgi:3D (Asp-Asp-Asp) domain-containing protein
MTKAKTFLVAFVMVVIGVSVGHKLDVAAPPDPWTGSQIIPVGVETGSAGNRTPGLVREVTAYNVGVREQTSDEPCIGATGKNLCRLVARGLRVCAANFVDPETILHIEGYGECIVLDRTHRRFAHRVDIAMKRNEVGRALEFGIQRRYVEVKSGRP